MDYYWNTAASYFNVVHHMQYCCSTDYFRHRGGQGGIQTCNLPINSQPLYLHPNKLTGCLIYSNVLILNQTTKQ